MRELSGVLAGQVSLIFLAPEDAQVIKFYTIGTTDFETVKTVALRNITHRLEKRRRDRSIKAS